MKPVTLSATLAVSVLTASLAAAREAVPPSIVPEMAEHTAHFDKTVYRIGGNVYSAVGWGLANTIMIDGDDGVIVVDVGEDIGSAREVHDELRKYSSKPVVAIVYTHFHPDHINGVKAYASADDVASGSVDVIAHESLLENVVNQAATVGPILAMRTGYTAGAFLESAQNEGMNLGIGPRPNIGDATFIAPSLTYSDRMKITVAGVELELLHVPSEAPDETAVYLPAQGILLSGETIQGPTLPNIHTLRGTRFRDPVRWYKSIDRLRRLRAEHLVPSHGRPVSGRDRVEEVLRMTRDGIQYIHDQTIRHMNRGLTPDELALQVALPPHLAEYRPYLREYYGTVKHSVRQIYNGYLGWFQGDPVALDPTPAIEKSRRYVGLMGGRDAVLGVAEQAYENGDYQWAAELATHLIRVERADAEARALKADSFKQLGYAQLNANWRNWYLTSARELDGSLDVGAAQRRLMAAIAAPDIIAALPAASILERLSVRLKAEETLDLHLVVGFRLTDSDEHLALEIRRGVVEFHANNIPQADAELVLDSALLPGLLAGQVSVEGARQRGLLAVRGDARLVTDFLGRFERLQPIHLTVR